MNKELLQDSIFEYGKAKGKPAPMIKVLSGTQGVDAVFLCNKTADCEFTAEKWGSVLAHSASHTTRIPKPKAPVETPETDASTSAEKSRPVRGSHKHKLSALLLDAAAQAEDLEKAAKDGEGNWKQRCLAAESKLRQIDGALKTLGITGISIS